jgi:tetratricopeptide (TPR) repeat protein
VSSMANPRPARHALALATLRMRSPRKAIELGNSLRTAGDVEGARQAYQRAIDSGDLHGAPAGEWSTGALLLDAGDVAGASAAFRRAIDSGHPAWSVRAALNLADLLEDGGDLAGAIEQYRFVADRPSDEPDLDVLVRRAAVRLEILLNQQGDQEAAAQVYRRAIGAGGTAERASFALNRAYELQRRGDVAAAVASYEEAIDLGDPVLSPRATQMLASLVEGH